MTIRPYQDTSKLYLNAKTFRKLFPGEHRISEENLSQHQRNPNSRIPRNETSCGSEPGGGTCFRTSMDKHKLVPSLVESVSDSYKHDPAH